MENFEYFADTAEEMAGLQEKMGILTDGAKLILNSPETRLWVKNLEGIICVAPLDKNGKIEIAALNKDSRGNYKGIIHAADKKSIRIRIQFIEYRIYYDFNEISI